MVFGLFYSDRAVAQSNNDKVNSLFVIALVGDRNTRKLIEDELVFEFKQINNSDSAALQLVSGVSVDF
jgi:DNA-dependent RNA polymerase auxiliary subunit epsilon